MLFILNQLEDGTDVVVDDLGECWYYDDEQGKIILQGDDSQDGGYYCDSLVDGAFLLVEYGYIDSEVIYE